MSPSVLMLMYPALEKPSRKPRKNSKKPLSYILNRQAILGKDYFKQFYFSMDLNSRLRGFVGMTKKISSNVKTLLKLGGEKERILN